MSYVNSLISQLEERKLKGLYRELVLNEGIDFWSNDYLGFAGIDDKVSSVKSGSGGSRLLAGNHAEHQDAEAYIADFHQAESALLFNSGYTANLGLLSCLADRHAVYIYDELCHASIIDGMRLSHADKIKYKHNDIANLENTLSRFPNVQKFVVTESVFSMDGDSAPLSLIANLCKNYNAELIVDEAHALGVFGEKGDGLCPTAFDDFKVLARVYTYGKSLGLHGAAIVGDESLRQFLINHSRPFIYSTAMAPETAIKIVERYERMKIGDSQKLLRQNIEYFKSRILEVGMTDRVKASDSGIQVAFLGSANVKDIAVALIRAGFALKAIFSPTVPMGAERIRICLHAHNTKEDIDKLVDDIRRMRA